MTYLARSTYPIVLMLCLLTACRSKRDRQQSTSASASVLAPLPSPEGLRIGDTPLPFRSALAIGTTGESALLVTLTTEAIDCKSLRNAYPQRPNDLAGTSLQFWVSQALNPDGSRSRWEFRSAYLHDNAGWRRLRTQAALIDEVVLDKEGLILRGLELAMLDGRKRNRRIAYQGTLEAQMCGRMGRKEKSRPQKNLKLHVADIPLEVRGASLRLEKNQYHLRLSRAPHDCNTLFTEDYDFYLDLVIEKNPASLKFATLQGSLFPNEPTGSNGRDQFQLTIPTEVEGRIAIPVMLKGKLELRTYSVVVDGRVQAQACVPSNTAGSKK